MSTMVQLFWIWELLEKHIEIGLCKVQELQGEEMLIEIEDHATGLKTIVTAIDINHAHSVLVSRGFKFLWKGMPSDYKTDSCAWNMIVDEEEVSAMVHEVSYMSIENIPQNMTDFIRGKRNTEVYK